MSKMTQEQYVEKRVAEGFTAEQAKAEYNHTDTPTTQLMKEKLKSDGKAPTVGESRQLIYEAIHNNPNRKKVYTPDFTLTKEYKGLASKDTSSMTFKERENLAKQMIHIQRNGTISEETKQKEIDKTLDIPIGEVIKQLKAYEAKVADAEEKIDNFDISPVQPKIDEITNKYNKKARTVRGNWAEQLQIDNQYNKEVDEQEFNLIIKPLNDLKIARYEADTYRAIYDARLKYFVRANKDLIEEELIEAKRKEIRASLLNLAPLVEEV